jgi:hypothetical protein
MSNTGVKIYRFLKEVNIVSGLPTGLVKPNVSSDPDYVAPVADYATCPIEFWRPINGECEKESGLNTGTYIYLQREKVINGVGVLVEDNVDGGEGPIFPPIYDINICPLNSFSTNG